MACSRCGIWKADMDYATGRHAQHRILALSEVIEAEILSIGLRGPI